MRVGIDYRPAMMATTGIGRYVAGLSARLAGACDLRLFGVFRKGNRPEVRRAPPGSRLLAWPVPTRLMQMILPIDRALGGCDLFHHTNYWLARVRPRVRQVITIHDLSHLRDPGFHTPATTATATAVLERACRVCAAFLVPSETTARDCEEFLNIPRDRIFVTPLGVDASSAEPARSTPYLLALGTLEPRKNHARLIRAYARLATDVPLRIVGKRGWNCDEVIELARATPGVTWTGHLPEEQMQRELAGATALLYPSLHEGFGLPVLEAMAAGVPVLTSDRDPMRAIAGDAALLTDPTDEEAIEDALRRLLEDDALRVRLALAGPRQARAYTWDECARRTRVAYEAVLA